MPYDERTTSSRLISSGHARLALDEWAPPPTPPEVAAEPGVSEPGGAISPPPPLSILGPLLEVGTCPYKWCECVGESTANISSWVGVLRAIDEFDSEGLSVAEEEMEEVSSISRLMQSWFSVGPESCNAFRIAWQTALSVEKGLSVSRLWIMTEMYAGWRIGSGMHR